MLTMDHTCAAPEEGAGSGGQPGEPPKRPRIETGSERPDVEPKRLRWRDEEKTEERDKQDSAVKTLCALSCTCPQLQQQQQPSNSSISSSGSTITAPNTNMKERIWSNRVANRTVSQPLHPGIGASLHNEHVITVQEEFELHLDFYQRDVAAGMWLLWKVFVDVISKSCQEAPTAVKALGPECSLSLGQVSTLLPVRVPTTVRYGCLRSTEDRQLAAHTPNCSVSDCDGVEHIEIVVCQGLRRVGLLLYQV